MKATSLALSIAFVSLMTGCASGAHPSPKTGGAETAPLRAAASVPKAHDQGTNGMIAISNDVRRACGISDADAYFAFDSSYVRPNDRRTLDKLTQCFSTGPLKGRAMQLVGHADPRGDDGYNLALGGARADSVKKFIVNGGLPPSKVATSSRGEMDATGTDETSWAKDRRVDVQIGS